MFHHGVCDLWIHRVRTGVFKHSVRKLRRHYNKSKTLNTLHLTLLILGIVSVCLVTSISFTEPSRVHVNANSNFITIGAKTDHSENSTAWPKNTLIGGLITIHSPNNGPHFQLSLFVLNVPDFD